MWLTVECGLRPSVGYYRVWLIVECLLGVETKRHTFSVFGSKFFEIAQLNVASFTILNLLVFMLMWPFAINRRNIMTYYLKWWFDTSFHVSSQDDPNSSTYSMRLIDINKGLWPSFPFYQILLSLLQSLSFIQ